MHRTSFALHLAGALLFTLLPATQFALAASEAKNCVAEPTQNMRVISGDVLSGANCLISPAADLDSFQFTGQAGHIYRVLLALDSGQFPNNICMDLYGPDNNKVFSGCSDTRVGRFYAYAEHTLTVAGLHTIVVTEAGNDAVVKYGISVERRKPAPPDAAQLIPGKVIADEINPLTDIDPFVFWAGPGVYRVILSIAAGGFPANVCFTVFEPGGNQIASSCTDSRVGNNSTSVDISPSQTGNHWVMIGEASGIYNIGYNLNVVCVTGCPPSAPPCILNHTQLTYNPDNDRLTMKFALAHRSEVHWTTWLTYGRTVTRMWSVLRPPTLQPTEVTRTLPNLPSVGRAGILSTFTTPETGITCSMWRLIETGPPEASSNLEAIVDAAISRIE